jgi:hypothetical protein
MSDFSKFIFSQGLMDIPPVSGNLTRSNNCDHLPWYRIDKFILSSDWEAQFLEASQRRLFKLLSDLVIS